MAVEIERQFLIQDDHWRSAVKQTLDEEFSRLPWRQREVTGEERYDNVFLAFHPYRSWRASR